MQIEQAASFFNERPFDIFTSFSLALIWPTTTMAVTNGIETSLQQKRVETNVEVNETTYTHATHH